METIKTPIVLAVEQELAQMVTIRPDTLDFLLSQINTIFPTLSREDADSQFMSLYRIIEAIPRSTAADHQKADAFDYLRIAIERTTFDKPEDGSILSLAAFNRHRQMVRGG